MASAFDILAADIAKDQGFPASIVKIELRENGGTSAQWVSYGDVTGAELNAEAKFQTVSGGAQRQHGMMITLTGNFVATGVNVRTALAKIADYVTDVRATDISGNTYTLAQEATGARGDLVIGNAITGSDTVDGDVLIPFTWTGYMTMAKWLACYAAAV